ncbi:MAG: hypothetical protein CVU91_03730 [Firmicutes bacterium HGW-Firmicutes-16]|nr:MAG: hypothetical protein CVU91_03730 [Firmicutes bacterium HGW-Firmicutes-16]
MIREIIAVSLLFALLALSLFNVKYIENKTDILANEIEQAHELYQNGDNEGAASHVEESLNNWLSWESYSHIMLRHSEIDIITGAYFALLEELEGDAKVTGASFDALIETLNDIAKKERITLGSLL